MLYALMGYVHALLGRAYEAAEGRVRRIQRLAGGEAGQGTVEYVGLILLVSLLMVGMVAAMKGFNERRTRGRTPTKGRCGRRLDRPGRLRRGAAPPRCGG